MKVILTVILVSAMAGGAYAGELFDGRAFSPADADGAAVPPVPAAEMAALLSAGRNRGEPSPPAPLPQAGEGGA